MPHVTRIYRYPVKGLNAERLERVAVAVGQGLALGSARLEMIDPIARCAATDVDPATAARDMAIPEALRRTWGYPYMGVCAAVVEGGVVALGDRLALT